MAKKAKKIESVIIHNIKNADFRQAHVDGAHGNVTPNGHININFFSQRDAIPKGTEFKINEDGRMGAAIKDIEGSKDGIVREFQFGIYMDIKSSVNLKNFLEKKIEEYNSLVQKDN